MLKRYLISVVENLTKNLMIFLYRQSQSLKEKNLVHIGILHKVECMQQAIQVDRKG